MLLCLFEFLLHFLKYLLKDYMFSSPEPSPDILYNSEAKIPMPKPNISMCKLAVNIFIEQCLHILISKTDLLNHSLGTSISS